jgi:hypothetical protein
MMGTVAIAIAVVCSLVAITLGVVSIMRDFSAPGPNKKARRNVPY